MEKLQDFLNKIPNAKILDVGTGRGNFISLIDHLYKDYEKIVGIDIVDRMVELSEEAFKDNNKIKIVKRDILNTGFPEEHFDIVCLSNSLHHLEDIKGTIEAMEKLTKPGGYLLFNEMMKDNLNEQQISHLLIHHFSAKLDREMNIVHNDTFNRQEIIDTISNNTKYSLVDFWDMEYEKSESTPEEIDNMVKTVDVLLMRLRNDELIAKYRQEADLVKEYIKNNGVEACTQLFVIVKKES